MHTFKPLTILFLLILIIPTALLAQKRDPMTNYLCEPVSQSEIISWIGGEYEINEPTNEGDHWEFKTKDKESNFYDDFGLWVYADKIEGTSDYYIREIIFKKSHFKSAPLNGVLGGIVSTDDPYEKDKNKLYKSRAISNVGWINGGGGKRYAFNYHTKKTGYLKYITDYNSTETELRTVKIEFHCFAHL